MACSQCTARGEPCLLTTAGVSDGHVRSRKTWKAHLSERILQSLLGVYLYYWTPAAAILHPVLSRPLSHRTLKGVFLQALFGEHVVEMPKSRQILATHIRLLDVLLRVMRSCGHSNRAQFCYTVEMLTGQLVLLVARLFQCGGVGIASRRSLYLALTTSFGACVSYFAFNRFIVTPPFRRKKKDKRPEKVHLIIF